MVSRGDLMDVARRALSHSENGTTDESDEVGEVAVADYVDDRIWELEMRRLFRASPVALALSAELPEPGDYKALTAAGLPVLITRGTDGTVRTFLNVCRHRGARLCEPGSGNKNRFTCPYHAWAYNDRGRLVGVYRADQFGQFDRDSRGLVALPTEERHGFVWAVLSPDGEMDLDGWLGGYATELGTLELERWHFHDQVELPGANWKVVIDGYLEGYHGDCLHAESLGTGSLPNLMLVDRYGPHQRLVFAQKTLTSLRDQPEDDWEPTRHCVPNHILFPNVSIAGAWHDLSMVCIVLPGATVGTSMTYQTVLTRNPSRTRVDRAIARKFSGLMLRVARDEDYPTVAGIQDGLASGANTHFLLGRNEVAVQHFHSWVRRLTGRDGETA
ncbi:MAG: aromatic ring-hydroxylating dioxygenase subunit alpha [Actinocatenispora sp.]